MKKNIKKEENKKKLSKNWKLYAGALAIMLIGASTGLGIYYGIINNSEVIKTDLSTLGLETTILSKKNMTQEVAFNDFLNANKNFTDLKTNLEIQENSFQKPTYATNGSLTINAKANSKYTGSVTVTITKLAQTNLNMLISNTTIQGREKITDKEAFNDFLNANKSWSNLNDFVEYSAFIAPTYISNGSLTITAKANTAFTGSVIVNIAKLAQTNLSTLELNTTIAAELNASQDQVFQAFLNKNANILGDNLTLEQVELTNYQSASLLINGKLTITVKAGINSKYIGTIAIVTQYILNDKNISDLIHYLSDNNLLNLRVPTGTPQDSNGSNILSTLIATRFRDLMTGIYQYASNIETIELYTYNQGPTQANLNSWYYVWHTPEDFFIEIAIIYKDQPKEIIHIDNIKATITISTKN